MIKNKHILPSDKDQGLLELLTKMSNRQPNIGMSYIYHVSSIYIMSDYCWTLSNNITIFIRNILITMLKASIPPNLRQGYNRNSLVGLIS